MQRDLGRLAPQEGRQPAEEQQERQPDLFSDEDRLRLLEGAYARAASTRESNVNTLEEAYARSATEQQQPTTPGGENQG